MDLFSQQISCEQITKFTLFEIYDELIQDNKYTIEDSKCFGIELSKQDSLKGIRQILTYHGPFTTGCLKCLYYKFGMETYEFAPNDLIFENVDTFVDSYNETMKSFLSDSQKAEIQDFDFYSNLIFTPYLTSQNQYKVEELNDSVVNLKIHADSLEFLFNSDIEYLRIKIGDSINDIKSKEYEYNELKNIGVDITLDSKSKKDLFICFDFSKMPNRYDICWCENLEKEYRMILPLKID